MQTKEIIHLPLLLGDNVIFTAGEKVCVWGKIDLAKDSVSAGAASDLTEGTAAGKADCAAIGEIAGAPDSGITAEITAGAASGVALKQGGNVFKMSASVTVRLK